MKKPNFYDGNVVHKQLIINIAQSKIIIIMPNTVNVMQVLLMPFEVLFVPIAEQVNPEIASISAGK